MADRFYQVQIQFTDVGQQMRNTLCIFGDDALGDFSPISAQGLADKVGGDATLMGKWAAMIGTGDHVDGVMVRELLAPADLSVPDEGFHAVGAAGTRSLAAGALPSPLCGLLKFKTNAAVRSGHGHIFLPPIRDAGVLDTDGKIGDLSWYQTAANSLAAELGHYNQGGSAWGGTLEPGSWGLGIYSRTRRARSLPQFAFHTTTITLDSKVHWLRSRRDQYAA